MKANPEVNWTPAERAAWAGASEETVSALLLIQKVERRLDYLEEKLNLVIEFLGLKDGLPNQAPAPEGLERGLSETLKGRGPAGDFRG